MPKLTKRLVDATKPEEKELFVWDEELRGFGLRVRPSGRRYYFVQYRNTYGRTRRLSLGQHGKLTPEAARNLAKKHLLAVCGGADPAAERQERRKSTRFGELADEYLQRHAKVRKRTWRQDQYMLDKDVLPYWEHRSLLEIRRTDVNAILDRIVDRGAHIKANRVLRLLSKIFNFGLSRGLVEWNPAHKIEPPGVERSRRRFLSPDEIRAFWRVLEEDGSLMARSFQLRLLTAQRGREVMTMRWQDLRGPWWTIPPEFTKNGQPHEVYLSEQTAEILGRIEQSAVWVFPGRRDPVKAMANCGKAIDRLREQAGLAHFTAHDLRRTVATHMARLGVPRLVIGKTLNHLSVDHGVSAIYDRHDYRPEKADALRTWGWYVESLVTDVSGCRSTESASCRTTRSARPRFALA